MSLKAAAQHLADYGRHGDTTLVHMTPDEVRGLQQLAQAHGTSLTINPHTGLPEAFSLKQLVKVAAPIALGAFLGPAGAAYGGGFFTAAQAGMAVGGLEALRTGSLEKGLMAGLSAYGAADVSGAAATTSTAEAAAKEQAVKEIAAQNAAATANEISMAGANPGLSSTMEAATAPGLQGAQTANLANEANMLTYGNEAQLANANAANAISPSGGFTGPAQVTPRTWGETLVNNPDAVAKQMGGYDKMARSGLMAAAPILTMAPEGPDAPPIPERYITPKYYDYRTQTYVDLPAVNTKDWGDKTLEGYRNSMVAKPVRTAADGGMMGSRTPYDSQDLAYNNEPVVRMAGGGVSDSQIKDYVAAHMGDPAAIAAAAQQYGVSAADLSRATGYSGEQVNNYFSDAGISSESFNPYASYSNDQMGAFFSDPKNANVDVGEAIRQHNANPNEVNRYVAGLTEGYADPTATQRGSGTLSFFDTLTKQGMTPEEYSAAAQGVNKEWGKEGSYWTPTTVSRAYDTAGKISAFDDRTDDIAPSDKEWYQFMKDNDLSVKDMSIATGLTESEIQDRIDYLNSTRTIAAPKTTGGIGGGSGGSGGSDVSAPRTTPATYAPPGTTNPYGNTYNPGDITVNADKTRTVTPNIPGRPYGGFTGMEQVRDAYTGGGGKLGQTLSQTKDYTNTGRSADAYGYLFGERAWPMPQQKKPVYADTVGNTTQKYIWKDGLLTLNPDYVDPAKKKDVVEGPVTKTDVLEAAGGGDKNGGLMHAYAAGGQTQYNLGGYSDGGRLLRGPGDGVSDSIPATIGGKQPARLADGEFVVPARIVSELGNGSTEAGARKLYAMMDRVQKARGKTVGKGKIAKNTRADKHLPV